MNGLLLCSSNFLIFMNYSLDKNHFGKKILYLRDQCPSNFNTLGCGHSLFPLRDRRGKRTREPGARAKSPMALKRDARVWSPRENRRPLQAIFLHSGVVLAELVFSGKSRPSSLSFRSGIVERNEQGRERARKSPAKTRR